VTRKYIFKVSVTDTTVTWNIFQFMKNYTAIMLSGERKVGKEQVFTVDHSPLSDTEMGQKAARRLTSATH